MTKSPDSPQSVNRHKSHCILSRELTGDCTCWRDSPPQSVKAAPELKDFQAGGVFPAHEGLAALEQDAATANQLAHWREYAIRLEEAGRDMADELSRLRETALTAEEASAFWQFTQAHAIPGVLYTPMVNRAIQKLRSISEGSSK